MRDSMEERQQETPVCQSCGMPMQVEDDFGTNADGSINLDYCRFCFKDGNFIIPDLTLEQQIERLVDIGMSALNMPEEKAREMAENTLPDLKRWQTKE